MKFLNSRFLGVLGICASVAIGAAAQSARPPAKKWPPQFPREGATKLFENDHVIVWEQVGRPKEAFQHKHIRDILNIGIDPGGGVHTPRRDLLRRRAPAALSRTV